MASVLKHPRRKRSSAGKSRKSVRPASNERLLKQAKVHRPPQSWFEQTDCPFTPKKG